MIEAACCPTKALALPTPDGAWCPSKVIELTNETKEGTMSRTQRYVKKHANAINRRRLHAKARHEHQQRQAQRAIEALPQALHDVGVPDDLVIEIEGRLRAQKKLLGKIVGLMFPPS